VDTRRHDMGTHVIKDLKALDHYCNKSIYSPILPSGNVVQHVCTIG
jgi:hypothetical protein